MRPTAARRPFYHRATHYFCSRKSFEILPHPTGTHYGCEPPAGAHDSQSLLQWNSSQSVLAVFVRRAAGTARRNALTSVGNCAAVVADRTISKQHTKGGHHLGPDSRYTGRTHRRCHFRTIIHRSYLACAERHLSAVHTGQHRSHLCQHSVAKCSVAVVRSGAFRRRLQSVVAVVLSGGITDGGCCSAPD